MNRAYIVMKKGYEYDDNTYNETEGGHPQIVCFTKKDAELKVKELDIKEFQSLSVFDYAYENECLNVEFSVFDNFNKVLVEKYGRIISKYSWDDTENKLHPKANENEINEYCKMVDVSFYEVVEVDVDTSSYREEKINQILD